jgi:hypothetical protein
MESGIIHDVKRPFKIKYSAVNYGGLRYIELIKAILEKEVNGSVPIIRKGDTWIFEEMVSEGMGDFLSGRDESKRWYLEANTSVH